MLPAAIVVAAAEVVGWLEQKSQKMSTNGAEKLERKEKQFSAGSNP